MTAKHITRNSPSPSPKSPRRSPRRTSSSSQNSSKSPARKRRRISLSQDTSNTTPKSPQPPSTPKSVTSTHDSSLDDIFNDDLGGFSKTQVAAGKSMKQGTLDRMTMPDMGLEEIVGDLMSELKRSQSATREFNHTAKERAAYKKQEKERLELEELREASERKDAEMNRRHEEEQAREAEDRLAKRSKISVVNDKFPNEIVLPQVIGLPVENTEPLSLEYSGTRFSDSQIRKDQEDAFKSVVRGTVSGIAGLSSADLYWLMKMAVLAIETDENSKISSWAFTLLMSSQTLYCESQCPSFEELRALILAAVNVDITEPFSPVRHDTTAPAVDSNVTITTTASKDTTDDWRFMRPPPVAQIQALDRLVYILSKLVRFNVYTTEEMDHLFYFMCSAATIYHSTIQPAVDQCMNAFARVHVNAQCEWTFPVAEQFTEQFVFVNKEPESINAYISVSLLAMISCPSVVVKKIASDYASMYCNQYVTHLNVKLSAAPTLGPVPPIPNATQGTLSAWLQHMCAWMRQRRASMSADLKHADKEVQLAAMRVLDELHWVLSFISVILCDALYKEDSTGQVHLQIDDLAAVEDDLMDILSRINRTCKKLDASRSEVIRLTSTCLAVTDIWKFSVKVLIQA